MYTQRNEESAILQACEKATRRRFLDIGAFDPVAMSNTRALYELGWRGVLVEPSPKCVRALVVEYGNVQDMYVLSGAVAKEAGIISLQISDDAVSSNHAENIREWQSRANYLGIMHVQAFTVKDLLNSYGAFDMVSIDVEGGSVDLLHDLLATEMFPCCIVVEHDGRILEAMQAARGRGYKPLLETEENLVFGL